MKHEDLIQVAHEAKNILTAVSLNSPPDNVRELASNCVDRLVHLLPAEPLKPCPFCGSVGQLNKVQGGYHKVSCSNRSCMVSQNSAHSESKAAVNSWNDRHNTGE